MNATTGYAAATVVNVAGHLVATRSWDQSATRATIAGLGLALVATMANPTPLAPLISAIGWVLLMAALIKAVPAFSTKRL